MYVRSIDSQRRGECRANQPLVGRESKRREKAYYQGPLTFLPCAGEAVAGAAIGGGGGVRCAVYSMAVRRLCVGGLGGGRRGSSTGSQR